jgi:hypothetical protein
MSKRPGVWRELFGIDLRSLALFRIGLAICVLADVAQRGSDLVAHYTDAGALPADLLFALQGRSVWLSLHYWTGAHPLAQAALFAATAIAAAALALGRFTWLANLACWYLVSSVQVRNPLVYIGGDAILRVLLFWGLFLPLGARLSLDAGRTGGRSRPDLLVSGASAALLLQVAFIYWVTGLRKSGPLWWSGQAVAYALGADEWATPIGIWLRGQSALLVWLDYLTLGIELAGPFLAFVPGLGAAPRLAAVALFWCFHGGLALCMNIGLFPLFAIVAWLPFLPGQLFRAHGSDPPTAAVPRARVPSIAALLVLLYVVVFLGEEISGTRVIPRPLRAVGKVLRLEQSWAMFAPDPPRTSNHYDLVVDLADGAQVRRPAPRGFREMLFLWRTDLVDLPPRRILEPFLAGACARWNSAESGPRAERIALRRIMRDLDRPASPPEEHPLHEMQCPAAQRESLN